MTMSNDPESPVISARRRLLRGSLSVPTVLTLSSGAALANTSSLRCFNNSATLLDPKTLSSFSRLQRYSKPDSNNITRYYIKRSDLLTISQQGARWNHSAVLGTAGKDYIRIDNYGGANLNLTMDNGEYVGLRFTYTPTATPKFAITGFIFSSQVGYGSGQVMYESCWTSFVGIT